MPRPSRTLFLVLLGVVGLLAVGLGLGRLLGFGEPGRFEAATSEVVDLPALETTERLAGTLPPPLTGSPAANAPPHTLDPALREAGEAGPLPVRSETGATALAAYARPAPAEAGPNRVAVVVTGLGLAHDISAKAVELDPRITLVYSPYAERAGDWQAHGRWHGHEVMLGLPLRPAATSADDPGPLALDPASDDAALLAGLEAVLARGGGYVGLAGPARGFAEAPERFGAVARALEARGLGLLELDGRHLAGAAEAAGLAYASAGIAIDADLAPSAIDAALAELEAEARRSGTAIGHAGLYPVTLDRLWAWARELDSQDDLSLVPASHLLEASDADTAAAR